MAEQDSDLVSVDLQNIPESALAPEGPVTLKVRSIERKVSSTNNPMLLWTFEVVNDLGIDYVPIWQNTSLQPQALYKLRDLVAACGVYPGAEGFKKSDCLGRMLRGWVKHEQYNGKMTAKVDDFAPIA
jgi:hypothetical protein